MVSTAFDLFLLPLFQGLAAWFLIMAVARVSLDKAARSWHHPHGHGRPPLR